MDLLVADKASGLVKDVEMLRAVEQFLTDAHDQIFPGVAETVQDENRKRTEYAAAEMADALLKNLFQVPNDDFDGILVEFIDAIGIVPKPVLIQAGVEKYWAYLCHQQLLTECSSRRSSSRSERTREWSPKFAPPLPEPADDLSGNRSPVRLGNSPPLPSKPPAQTAPRSASREQTWHSSAGGIVSFASPSASGSGVESVRTRLTVGPSSSMPATAEGVDTHSDRQADAPTVPRKNEQYDESSPTADVPPARRRRGPPYMDSPLSRDSNTPPYPLFYPALLPPHGQPYDRGPWPPDPRAPRGPPSGGRAERGVSSPPSEKNQNANGSNGQREDAPQTEGPPQYPYSPRPGNWDWHPPPAGFGPPPAPYYDPVYDYYPFPPRGTTRSAYGEPTNTTQPTQPAPLTDGRGHQAPSHGVRAPVWPPTRGGAESLRRPRGPSVAPARDGRGTWPQPDLSPYRSGAANPPVSLAPVPQEPPPSPGVKNAAADASPSKPAARDSPAAPPGSLPGLLPSPFFPTDPVGGYAPPASSAEDGRRETERNSMSSGRRFERGGASEGLLPPLSSEKAESAADESLEPARGYFGVLPAAAGDESLERPVPETDWLPIWVPRRRPHVTTTTTLAPVDDIHTTRPVRFTRPPEYLPPERRPMGVFREGPRPGDASLGSERVAETPLPVPGVYRGPGSRSARPDESNVAQLADSHAQPVPAPGRTGSEGPADPLTQPSATATATATRAPPRYTRPPGYQPPNAQPPGPADPAPPSPPAPPPYPGPPGGQPYPPYYPPGAPPYYPPGYPEPLPPPPFPPIPGYASPPDSPQQRTTTTTRRPVAFTRPLTYAPRELPPTTEREPIPSPPPPTPAYYPPPGPPYYPAPFSRQAPPEEEVEPPRDSQPPGYPPGDLLSPTPPQPRLPRPPPYYSVSRPVDPDSAEPRGGAPLSLPERSEAERRRPPVSAHLREGRADGYPRDSLDVGEEMQVREARQAQYASPGQEDRRNSPDESPPPNRLFDSPPTVEFEETRPRGGISRRPVEAAPTNMSIPLDLYDADDPRPEFGSSKNAQRSPRPGPSRDRDWEAPIFGPPPKKGYGSEREYLAYAALGTRRSTVEVPRSGGLLPGGDADSFSTDCPECASEASFEDSERSDWDSEYASSEELGVFDRGSSVLADPLALGGRTFQANPPLGPAPRPAQPRGASPPGEPFPFGPSRSPAFARTRPAPPDESALLPQRPERSSPAALETRAPLGVLTVTRAFESREGPPLRAAPISTQTEPLGRRAEGSELYEQSVGKGVLGETAERQWIDLEERVERREAGSVAWPPPAGFWAEPRSSLLPEKQGNGIRDEPERVPALVKGERRPVSRPSPPRPAWPAPAAPALPPPRPPGLYASNSPQRFPPESPWTVTDGVSAVSEGKRIGAVAERVDPPSWASLPAAQKPARPLPAAPNAAPLAESEMESSAPLPTAPRLTGPPPRAASSGSKAVPEELATGSRVLPAELVRSSWREVRWDGKAPKGDRSALPSQNARVAATKIYANRLEAPGRSAGRKNDKPLLARPPPSRGVRRPGDPGLLETSKASPFPLEGELVDVGLPFSRRLPPPPEPTLLSKSSGGPVPTVTPSGPSALALSGKGETLQDALAAPLRLPSPPLLGGDNAPYTRTQMVTQVRSPKRVQVEYGPRDKTPGSLTPQRVETVLVGGPQMRKKYPRWQ
nr:TPA: hypothetical protein BN1204_027840 [Neospora caninum Liverpool]